MKVEVKSKYGSRMRLKVSDCYLLESLSSPRRILALVQTLVGRG